jgi:hypothetical protein
MSMAPWRALSLLFLSCAPSLLESGCIPGTSERDSAQPSAAARESDDSPSLARSDAGYAERDAARPDLEAGLLPFDAAAHGFLDAAHQDASGVFDGGGPGPRAAETSVLSLDSSVRAADGSDDALVGETASDAALAPRPAPLADQTAPTMVNGISIDESGYLWVAAGAESQLLRLEPPGEKIVERHATEWALDGPDDLVATPEAVYYTAMAAGNVDKLDRRTGRNSVLARVGIGANPIVLTSAGVLLVGIAPGPAPELGPLFTGLFEVDKAGLEPPRTILRDSRSINAFCVAPDGFAYGPTQTAVLRIDLAQGTITTVREGFSYAGSVRYNPRDKLLYVLDVYPKTNPRAATLYRMALDGSNFSEFARLSEVAEDSYSADNFAIAQDGTFFVTRLYEPKITRVSADGTHSEDFVIGKPAQR